MACRGVQQLPIPAPPPLLPPDHLHVLPKDSPKRPGFRWQRMAVGVLASHALRRAAIGDANLSCLRDTLAAYAVVRTRLTLGQTRVVAHALKAAAPLLRDLAVFQAADVAGITDRAAFLQALVDASDGQREDEEQLVSQLLHAFKRTLGVQEGAFQSKNSRRKKRPARARRACPRASSAEPVVGAAEPGAGDDELVAGAEEPGAQAPPASASSPQPSGASMVSCTHKPGKN